MKRNAAIAACLLLLAACNGKQPTQGEPVLPEENLVAKQMLQGTWMDELTEEVSFRAEGDTIFFADGTSLPAAFSIVGDSICLGSNTYRIEQQAEHIFCIENQTGDLITFVRYEATPSDSLTMQPVSHEVPPIVTEVVNRDDIVFYGGERYHWYVTINPTRYRVTRTAYNDDGVGVENVYFDNIVHISIYQGKLRIFGRDFSKQMFSDNVPENFLSQAILGDIVFSHADSRGFHFNATICIPDAASCYMVETLISHDGKLSMKLLEY